MIAMEERRHDPEKVLLEETLSFLRVLNARTTMLLKEAEQLAAFRRERPADPADDGKA